MAPRSSCSSRSARRRAAGLTLVELLAAMAIFLGLAGMVLQVLGGGLDLWNNGERGRDESEQAAALLDRLGNELRHAASVDGGDGEPRVKFYCDMITLDADGDSTRDFQAQRLVFVRQLVEERAHPQLRRAGIDIANGGNAADDRVPGVAGAVPYVGSIDSPDARFFATEGLVEEALVPQPDPRPGYEGRMVLWRALMSPPGGPDSLFAQALADDGGLARAPLEPLAENVLLFSLAFIDDTVRDLAAGPDAGGPLALWDSTRGLLPAGEGFSGFRHGRGPTSRALADDDVFPSAVRITLVVAPPPGESPSAELASDVPASTGTLRVDVQNGRYLKKLGTDARVLKLGQEWVEVAESDGSTLLLTRRGLYGTAPSIHLAGTKVLTGRRFERTIALSCGRGDLMPRDDRGERR